MNIINMKRSFVIEMNDNTTIEAAVEIILSTDDEYNAEKQINRISMGELFIPIEQVISTMIGDTQDEEEDEDSIENKSKDIGLIDPCPWCQSKLFLVRDKSDYFTQCENCEFEIEHDAEEINEMLKDALKAKYADRDDEDGEDSIE
jgi:hypothetical protein